MANDGKKIDTRHGRPLSPAVIELIAICAERFNASDLTYQDVANETGLDRADVSRLLRTFKGTYRTYTRIIAYYGLADGLAGEPGLFATVAEIGYHADRMAVLWRRVAEIAFSTNDGRD